MGAKCEYLYIGGMRVPVENVIITHEPGDGTSRSFRVASESPGKNRGEPPYIRTVRELKQLLKDNKNSSMVASIYDPKTGSSLGTSFEFDPRKARGHAGRKHAVAEGRSREWAQFEHEEFVAGVLAKGISYGKSRGLDEINTAQLDWLARSPAGVSAIREIRESSDPGLNDVKHVLAATVAKARTLGVPIPLSEELLEYFKDLAPMAEVLGFLPSTAADARERKARNTHDAELIDFGDEFGEVRFADADGPVADLLGAVGRRRRLDEDAVPRAPVRIVAEALAPMLEFKETRKQAKKYEYVAPSETLPPMSYTIVEKERVVVTVTADGVETKNTAAPGDALMSGPSGELYVVRSGKFATLYEGTPGSTVVPDQSPRRVARYTGDGPAVFTAPWGEDMVVKPGDYLVADGDGFYRVAREEYEKTYDPLPGRLLASKETWKKMDDAAAARNEEERKARNTHDAELIDFGDEFGEVKFADADGPVAEPTHAPKISKEELVIGDRGPGGGIIFSAKSGRYLEAAPEDIGPYTWEEGVAACRNYSYGGCTDWYLPSKNELNQLYLNRKIVGGFSTVYYWSSSEIVANGAWYQYFYDGDQVNDVKNSTYYVRPVRAFSI